MGELKKLKQDSSHKSDWYSLGVLLPVGLSCLFGLSISFFWIFLSQGYICNRFYWFRQCEQASDGGNKSCHMG